MGPGNLKSGRVKMARGSHRVRSHRTRALHHLGTRNAGRPSLRRSSVVGSRRGAVVVGRLVAGRTRAAAGVPSPHQWTSCVDAHASRQRAGHPPRVGRGARPHSLRELLHRRQALRRPLRAAPGDGALGELSRGVLHRIFHCYACAVLFARDVAQRPQTVVGKAHRWRGALWLATMVSLGDAGSSELGSWRHLA